MASVQGRPADRHLIVARFPAGLTADPAALLLRLIKRLEPVGDYALSAQETASGPVLLCAFALAIDADRVGEALDAHRNVQHGGWASTHHGKIDSATAQAIGRDCASLFQAILTRRCARLGERAGDPHEPKQPPARAEGRANGRQPRYS